MKNSTLLMLIYIYLFVCIYTHIQTQIHTHTVYLCPSIQQIFNDTAVSQAPFQALWIQNETKALPLMGLSF